MVVAIAIVIIIAIAAVVTVCTDTGEETRPESYKDCND
jgi:hypothetical protein